MDLVVKPHVGNRHTVLGEGPCLVRADGGRGAQGLYSLQVFHQAVLPSHALGSQRQAHLGAGKLQAELGGKLHQQPECQQANCPVQEESGVACRRQGCRPASPANPPHGAEQQKWAQMHPKRLECSWQHLFQTEDSPGVH